jgi:transposase
VLVTGLPWRLVPQEMGCSGVTAWRRLLDWQAAGVWARLPGDAGAPTAAAAAARPSAPAAPAVMRSSWCR